MAYAVQIIGACDEPGCTKPGTYEVRNNRNAPMRRCCQRHAEAAVARLSAAEDANP